ncbi:glycosyltransferase [Microbacterium sp. HJ5]
MGVRAPRLPAGRHFAVTWSVPDDFGGMTEAMLRRSRAFDQVADTPVDVLTFDARPDYPEVERRLRASGALSPGIRILNLYDWLREHELPGSSGVVAPSMPVAAGDAAVERIRDGAVLSRVRHDGEGRMLQTDHFRADGSLLVGDHRDARRRGEVGGRRIVLHDRRGNPVREWRRMWHLYADWLDALTAGEPSWFIVDSKTIAPFMLDYRRPHVFTAHVVHGSHRDASGALKASRRTALTRSQLFDVVAVLTASQARDLRRDAPPGRNVAVLPNVGPARPSMVTDAARPVTSGIVIASLTRRKRVSHAIAAARLVTQWSAAPITLDVFGDGESRAALERQAAGDRGIRLHGHVPDARERLAAASFALFTAHSEGFPLALVEAMAAGCVPIAYDIDYGPRDIIRDGRNGFLVPAGDTAALARAIARFVALPERTRRRMRERAVRSTRAFAPEMVVGEWAEAFELAWMRRALRRSPAIRAAASRWPAARDVATTALRAVTRVRRVSRWAAGSPG